MFRQCISVVEQIFVILSALLITQF